MDKSAVLKVIVAAVAAAVACASGQFVAGDAVNVSAVVSAVVTTVAAFLKQSPVSK